MRTLAKQTSFIAHFLLLVETWKKIYVKRKDYYEYKCTAGFSMNQHTRDQVMSETEKLASAVIRPKNKSHLDLDCGASDLQSTEITNSSVVPTVTTLNRHSSFR